MEINNNTVIVTGGASGLGAATAEMIVAQGGNVIIADMNAQAGSALAAKLGDSANFIECDVTKEDHAHATVDLAKTTFGGLQGLVNCARAGQLCRNCYRRKNYWQKWTTST